MKRLVALVLLEISIAVLAFAQARPAAQFRLTIEDALRWRLASSPALSPDGKRVAYLVSENDFEKSRVVTHLWWVETDTKQARRLTHSDAGAAAPLWSPDGRWLAFIAARNGDEKSRKPQVWLLAVAGGEAAQLTRAPEGVLHYRWSPDSKTVYYVAREPLARPLAALREEQRQARNDSVVVDEEKFRREIWRVSLDDRRADRLFVGDPGLEDVAPSPDGKWLLYRTNYTGEPDHSRRFDLWLFDLATRKPRQLTRRDGQERSPVWSSDSARVAFLAPRVPEIVFAQEEVFTVPVAFTGEPPEPQRLTKDFAGNIERLHWPAGGDGIYFAAAVRAGNRLFRLNPADGSVRPASSETLILSDADWTPDGASCSALQEGPDALPDLVLLRPASTLVAPAPLTALNPQLKSFALGAQEIVTWKSKDGLEMEGVLVKPPDWQPGVNYPLLLDIHGGPHDRRANTLTTGNLPPQLWAARGWLVFQPNFRGSSAYGHDFGVASRGDIGGKDYEDILTGVDFLIARGGVDAGRMAVIGGSYGGYMTNWIIGQTARFKAAVSSFGIFNLITDFSNSQFPSWETDYLQQFYWGNLQIYLDRSPFKNVTKITTPVLILHGDDDTNTFISNSKELYQALKALGRTVKFVRFPREGHGFEEPNHHIEEFRQMAAWLDRYVLGDEARARIANETVRKDAWELRVAAVRTPESYAGVKATGRFVEVELILRVTLPIEERLSLLVFDTAGSEVTLAAPERTLFPLGIAAESLGQRVLVKSSAQVVALVPDRDGDHSALAVAVVFDAPLGAREFTLKVKDFPPVKIELPVERKE
ncbi:MAG: S9 family peptidase [Acidobacteria bacterium]|nr:S9 family peptidase [Acidobacteriota bacterium]